MLGSAGQSAPESALAVPSDLRVIWIRPVPGAVPASEPVQEGQNLNLPVSVSTVIDEYIIRSLSLPSGISAANSPVQPLEALPETLSPSEAGASLVLDLADWTSLCLLPHLIDFFLGKGCVPDIHLLCRSTLGTDILPSERYVPGARLYGGLREATLMASRYSRTSPVRWFIWDIVPVFSGLHGRMSSCLNFIKIMTRIEVADGMFRRLQAHHGSSGGLYPSVCFAGSISEIRDDTNSLREEIRSNAISRLRALLRERGAAFPDADKPGWDEIEWMRRPSFYEARWDLERYLGSHVWKGPGWNSLWEGALGEAAQSVIESAASLLPAVEDIPGRKWGRKPEKEAEACKAWLTAVAEKGEHAAASIMEAAKGSASLAGTWLESSPFCILGYGMSGKDTLLDYLAHKLAEIQVRLGLSKLDWQGLSVVIGALGGAFRRYGDLPEGILQKGTRERNNLMEEFNRERREDLETACRDAMEAISEYAWRSALEAGRDLIVRLQAVIPAFSEALAALPAGDGDDGGRASWLGDLALDTCDPSVEWEGYWDAMWKEILALPDTTGIANVISKHIGRLADLPPEMMARINLAASAGIVSGKPFPEVRPFWAAMKDNLGVTGDGAEPWLRLVEEQEYSAGAELAGRIARLAEPGCRFFESSPRLHAFLIGELDERERDRLFAETLMWTQVPGSNPPGARLTVVGLTEPFGFDRLQVFRETAADWLVWIEEKRRAGVREPAGHAEWLPLAGDEAGQFRALGTIVAVRIADVLQKLAEGSLDWDESGKITVPAKGGQKDLAEWFSQHWLDRPADGWALTWESLQGVDDAHLEGIMEQASRVPMMDLFLGPIREDSRAGLVRLQKKLADDVSKAGIWTFRQTT